MAEYEPYTKEERERLVASMERWNMLGQDRVIEVFAGAVVIEVRRYEATVAALEAELARLREKAEVGEAVEAMPVGDLLWHVEGGWYAYKNAVNTKTGMQRDGVAFDENSPVVALAALRAAKGEADAHYP